MGAGLDTFAQRRSDLRKPAVVVSTGVSMYLTKEAGTPFLSLFSPEEILSLAKEAGFKEAEYVSGEDIYERYFASRSDGLRPGNAEAFLVAGY